MDGRTKRRLKYFDEAAKLYAAGLSVAEVAHHYGVSRQNMYKALRRRGVEMRSQLKYSEDNHFYRGGSFGDRRVQHLTERAIQKGILHRPEKCSECGGGNEFIDGRATVQAHHDDYNKPLEVRWLCQRCHHEWHRHHQAVPLEVEREASPQIDVIAAGFP